jgi:hypothetical protein
MTEDEVVNLETEAIRAVRAAFEAIESVASGRLNRDTARELFDQCLTAHDLARAARDGMRGYARHRHAVAHMSH